MKGETLFLLFDELVIEISSLFTNILLLTTVSSLIKGRLKGRFFTSIYFSNKSKFIF